MLISHSNGPKSPSGQHGCNRYLGGGESTLSDLHPANEPRWPPGWTKPIATQLLGNPIGAHWICTVSSCVCVRFSPPKRPQATLSTGDPRGKESVCDDGDNNQLWTRPHTLLDQSTLSSDWEWKRDANRAASFTLYPVWFQSTCITFRLSPPLTHH